MSLTSRHRRPDFSWRTREQPTNPPGAKRAAVIDDALKNAVIPEQRRICRSGAAPNATGQKVVGAAHHLSGHPSHVPTLPYRLPHNPTPIQIVPDKRDRVVFDTSVVCVHAGLPDTCRGRSTPATSAEPTAARNGARSRWVGSSAVTSSPTSGLRTHRDARERRLARSGG
ncbi:MAG: hypothetical protein QOI23_1422 [Chloroflexota bacterium]|nr:hypothetical protein [Chloroflexota bacterium]